MKQITTTLLAIFAFSVATVAQTSEKAETLDTKFRIKTGLNISTISNDSYSKSKAGFHIGAAAEFFITDKFSIQPELQYSTQGAKADDDLKDYFNVDYSKLTAKLNYLNVPIMAKYYVAEGFSIQAGPQLGFLVKAEAEVKGFNGISATQDIKSDVNKVDFGLNFGLGYDLPFGLFFDARYNLGLTNFNKEGNDSNQHRVFQLSVGYKF